jgi:hypothetical protein
LPTHTCAQTCDIALIGAEIGYIRLCRDAEASDHAEGRLFSEDYLAVICAARNANEAGGRGTRGAVQVYLTVAP